MSGSSSNSGIACATVPSGVYQAQTARVDGGAKADVFGSIVFPVRPMPNSTSSSLMSRDFPRVQLSKF